MKILVLGKMKSPITPVIRKTGCEVIESLDPVDRVLLEKNHINFIVSFGCRHIIKKSVLEYLPDRVINLHISYLPWNRGADPNLWSFLEDTPKGVSIHYIDEGIDTGDIIAQKRVSLDENSETLATSYDKLEMGIIELFKETWPNIIINNVHRLKQRGAGSFHKTKDKSKHMNLLTDGWNTEVKKLIGAALIK